jgi:hypothetical protein
MAEHSNFYNMVVAPVDELTEHVFEAVAHFRDRDEAVLEILDVLRDFATAEYMDSLVRIRDGKGLPADYQAANVVGWLTNRADEFAKESEWIKR